MIRLQYSNGRLLVEGEELDEWENNLFFAVSLGFDHDYVIDKLVLPEGNDVFHAIQDILAFLAEKQIEFEADTKVKQLISDMEEEQREYRYAVHSARNLPSIKKPRDLIRDLKPYQQKAFEHLATIKHSANFSVPGSGKTSVVYAAFSHLREKGMVEKLLVIGPLSCFQPWEEEGLACFGHPPSSARLSGTKNSRQSIFMQAEKFELFLCGYQAASNDLQEIIDYLLKKYKFMLVIDESHNIKRFHEGIWAESMLTMARYAAKRAILTGTPAPNSYYDLWSQFTFLWPGKNLLGTKEEYQSKAESLQGRTEIKDAIRPFFFRVRKSELNLPEPVFKHYSCDMKPYQSQIYDAIATKFLTELKLTPQENINLREWRRAKIVRLIQTASNPTLLARYSEEFDIKEMLDVDQSMIDLIEKYPTYEVPAKIEQLSLLVDELIGSGKKVVVWTSFIHNILSIKKILDSKNILTYVIYGGIPKDEDVDIEFNREQQIRDFKKSAKPCVLLANPAACAESISLHKSVHDAIYLDRTFDCGQYLQSLDRLHRIGLSPDEIVTYHLLLSNNSIDETIDRRLLEKEQYMLNILEDDLPVGGFQTEEHSMFQSPQEELEDYSQTVIDIRKKLRQ